MAKMKVHELAKELDIQSKEVLNFLQEKGVDVKAPQSIVEEDAAESVRKKFTENAGKPTATGKSSDEGKHSETAKASETVKTAEVVKPAEVVKTVETVKLAETESRPKIENTSQSENSVTSDSAKAEVPEKTEDHESDVHKKKKSIIFVSNPYNSKMAGAPQQKPSSNYQGSNQRPGNTGTGQKPTGQGNISNTQNNQQFQNRPLIKPSTPPSQPTASTILRGSQQGQSAQTPVTEEIKATTVQIPSQQASVQQTIQEKTDMISGDTTQNVQTTGTQAQTSAVATPVSEESKNTVQNTAASLQNNSNAVQNASTTGQSSNYQGQRPQSNYQGQNNSGTGQSSNYQGQRPQSNYQGQRPQSNYQGQNSTGSGQSSNYQGQRPQSNYQGQNSTGSGQSSNYQGQRPQSNYQGQNSTGSGQSSNYQGQRPQSNYQGQNSNYQGQRPQSNYQGQNPTGTGQSSNYQGQRPQSNYQGQNSNYQGQRPPGTYQGQNSNYQGQRPAGQGTYQPREGGYQGQNSNYQGQNSNYQGQRPAGQGTYQGQRPAGQGGYSNTGAPGSRPYNSRPYTGGQGSSGGQYGNRTSSYGNKDDDTNTGNRFGTKKPQGGKSFVPEGPTIEAEKHRDEEKRRIGQEKDKRSKKDLIYEEEMAAKNKKAGKFIRPEKKAAVIEEQIKVIILPEVLTIKDLAEKMKIQPSTIVKKLFLKGQIVTVNQEISYEDAENIAIEYDVMCEAEVKIDVIEELLKEEEDNEENMVARPPVICVMGHVDHGKTSLLDAIRKTNVTDREAGGITQHIGAYTVTINNKKITFLDTPGHEAFTAMRMRGANATDIAVLVVAADDGVMPQTIEAINHAKAAGIEIIVAVNKIDKPNANIERVKQELTEYELVAEDWGGSTVFAPVSARTGEGIEQLLELITLTADILELKANTDRRGRGLVIEAELDKGRGPVATVLVQKGTLRVGDFISAGAAHGKVRAMIDDKGRRVKEALPSTPVEILGLNDVPNAGEVFIAHNSDKEAKSFADTFVSHGKEKMLEDTKAKMSLDDLFTQIQAGNLKELNLIVKADVQGSVEAVKQSLLKLSNEEVVVKCIHGGVGAINESDVILASASSAIIIGFNVRPDVAAKATAEKENVDLRLYKVIYKAIEDIEAAMKGMRAPVYEEKIIGHAEIRAIFKASAIGNIAGAYIMDGTFQRNCKVRITRQGKLVFEGGLKSLKREKDDVKEVKTGFECGMLFEEYDQMQELDMVEAYIMVEVPR